MKKSKKYQALENLELKIIEMMQEFDKDIKSIKKEMKTYKTQFIKH